MTPERLRRLLEAVRAGEVTPENACERLSTMPFEDLGFAKVDHHRSLRTGMPEVIYSQGKTAEQVARIFASLAASGVNVLATRASAEQFEAVQQVEPKAVFHEVAACITLRQTAVTARRGSIAVVCAGTSDLPVAEEACVTAELMGNKVDRIVDVGVAGLHRLIAQYERLREASVLIVCAGMEGALPSVGGRPGRCAGDCGADKRRLRGVVRRHCRVAGDAECVRAQRDGGQHRQWVWGGLCGQPDEPLS